MWSLEVIKITAKWCCEKLTLLFVSPSEKSHTPPPENEAEHSFCEEFSSEFIAAIFVASLLSVATYYFHLLDATKNDFFELALTQLPLSQFATPKDKSTMPDVRLYTIDDTHYEQDFFATSPLNRQTLLSQLRRLFPVERELPKIQRLSLFIDLDISPALVATDKSDTKEEEAALYTWLKSLAAAGVNITLPVPMPSAAVQTIGQKLTWLNDMDKADIRFTVPIIPSTDGVVLTYWTFCHSLSQTGLLNKPESGNCKPFSTENWLALLHKESYPQRLDDLTTPAHLKASKRWLNFGFFRQLKSIPLSTANPIEPNWLTSPKDKYLVVGGTYGLRDRYDTPMGTRYGVEIHAASLYSQYTEVKDAVVFSYLLEILLGTFVGLLFTALAKLYRTNQSLLYLGANIIAQPAIVFLFIYGSALLLVNCNVHINAGVMGVAMSVHANFVRLEEPKEKTRLSYQKEKILRWLLWWFVFLAGLFVILSYQGVLSYEN